MSLQAPKAWSIRTSKREISNYSRYSLKWQNWTNPVFDLNKPETFKFSLFRVGTDLFHRNTLKSKPISVVDALLFSLRCIPVTSCFARNSVRITDKCSSFKN